MYMHAQYAKKAEFVLVMSLRYFKASNDPLLFPSQEGEALKREKEAAGLELERLQLTVKEGELVKQQLTVQVADLKGAKETSSELKEELNSAKTE